MRISFPSLRYALLVGIGGGVPVETNHGKIRLGHVVVGIPTGIYPGVVQYDHGKFKTGLFERTGSLSPPPTALLSAVHALYARRRRMDYDPVWTNLKRIRPQLNESYKFPGVENDHLYQPDYEHQVEGVSCEKCLCQQEKRIERLLDEDAESRVVVHTGTIASGESVIKSAEQRNKLVREHNVLCFETEAAGALIDFPCMVIRGISDYCDSHKNDVWHAYASAVAAAYARALICCLPEEEIKR
jgi:nucleoside phosphorylase